MFVRTFMNKSFLLMTIVGLTIGLSACKTSQPSDLSITPVSIWASGQPPTRVAGQVGAPTLSYRLPPTRVPGSPELTPTPDAPHYKSDAQPAPQSYVVQPGDMLSAIAQKYSISMQVLAQANNITDVNA
jgi:LysM repeat protein